MAVIEYDEYKQKLQALEPTLGELEKALGIPKAREELAELQKETEQEGFWNDLERSQQVSRQVKRLENKIDRGSGCPAVQLLSVVLSGGCVLCRGR